MKKFRDYYERVVSKYLSKKTIRVMKMTLVLSMLTIVQLWANETYSQSTKISLKLDSVRISYALEEIENQSEFYFLYSPKLIDVDKKVNINVENKPICDILDNIFGNNIKFAVTDRQIILTPLGNSGVISMLQQKQVKGTVTGKDGSPLPGVNVVISGTTQGVTTDNNGKYQIDVTQGVKSLVFSFIGMEPQEISIGTSTELDVVLSESAVSLQEVLVIGYGTIKRSDLTGSVSSVKGDNISIQAVGNPVKALGGVAAGVQILQESGEPGSSLSVLIRGGNSLLGSNNPLYVVDGFPIIGDLNRINTNDIQSIEILKDASATAIYGARGANGVVLVTTKKGKDGKTSISYNGYYGIQKASKTIDMLNAKEFATLANVRAANDNMAPYFSDSDIASFSTGTDWQKEIFQAAPIQNHSLTISGGNSKTLFNVSGSYFDQNGIIINSGSKQLQLRTNLEHKITPGWKVSLVTVNSNSQTKNLFSNNTERGAGVLSGALIAPPTLSVRDDFGNYNNVRAYAFSPDILENPVAMALERKSITTTKSLLLNFFTEVNITKDLVFYSSVGVQYENSRADFYSPSIFQPTALGSASIAYTEISDIVNENLLTYTKKIGLDHELKIMGGLTSEKSKTQYLLGSATGFLTNILQNYSLQSGSYPGTPNSTYSDYSIRSWLGRFNYSYRNKYLFTTSFRADGSSRFGKSNKWGYFPSAALAWKVSEENFLKGNNRISDLKLRTSWGKTGNTAVSPYQSLSVLSSVQTVFDDNISIGYAPGSLMPNPDLRWETTNQIDAGADLGLFKNRLSFTFDYYIKKTNDLLASIPVSPSSGYSSQTTNLGSIQNKGFELSMNARIIDGIFNWSAGANIAINKNKVISLPQGGDIFGVSMGNALPAMSLVREGYPIGVFYGYVEDGLTEDGLIKYVDSDGNGSINSLDRKIIGDPNPDFIFGINSEMSYRNFSLSILINGVQGNNILNYNLSNVADGFSFGINQIRDVLGNYWTTENNNPNAKYPRISKNTRYLGSDRFIEDGSYVQIKNIVLSYSFKGEKFKSSPFNNSEIYLNVQNLITLTRYSFYSPAINTRGGGISKGIDQFGYPDARTIMVGVRINL